MDPSFLQTLWFILISILWLGYFVLEGYDFGVGMLLPGLGRDTIDRRMILHSIGPYWDGNEVWLLVAGGATFAAFPGWYATLFSGFYLALFLILAALIVRNVGFEFWGKQDSARWRRAWEWAIGICSGLAALLWGVGWANIVGGSPIGRDGEFTGTLFSLLVPYALLGGLTTLLLFLAHGAIFLSLRTTGELEQRARLVAARVAPAAAVAVIGFLAWTLIKQSDHGGIEVACAILAVAAALLAIAAVPALRRSSARAFALTTGAILALFTTLFVDLFPHAMISSTSSAYDLTLRSVSSTHYTLTVMTVVAVVLVPLVLAYQAWTYWVFRDRLRREDYVPGAEPARPTPLDALSSAGRQGAAH